MNIFVVPGLCSRILGPIGQHTQAQNQTLEDEPDVLFWHRVMCFIFPTYY
jgi:hypothetical protein